LVWKRRANHSINTSTSGSSIEHPWPLFYGGLPHLTPPPPLQASAAPPLTLLAFQRWHLPGRYVRMPAACVAWLGRRRLLLAALNILMVTVDSSHDAFSASTALHAWPTLDMPLSHSIKTAGANGVASGRIWRRVRQHKTRLRRGDGQPRCLPHSLHYQQLFARAAGIFSSCAAVAATFTARPPRPTGTDLALTAFALPAASRFHSPSGAPWDAKDLAANDAPASSAGRMAWCKIDMVAVIKRS